MILFIFQCNTVIDVQRDRSFETPIRQEVREVLVQPPWMKQTLEYSNLALFGQRAATSPGLSPHTRITHGVWWGYMSPCFITIITFLSLSLFLLSFLFGGKSLKSKCLLTGGCITRYFFSAFILMELLARGRSCPWLSVLYHEFL